MTKLSASFPFLVDSMLAIQNWRVATQVRNSHLLRNEGQGDENTRTVFQKTQELEEFIENLVADQLKTHPAYHWFSRIKGIGNENIAKIVGLIDINRAPTVSSLWKYAGYHVVDGKGPKKTKGQKLEYNARLRTMCWRTAGALMKAGLRQVCAQCQAPRKRTEDNDVAPCRCGSTVFQATAKTRYAEIYLAEKARLTERYAREGRQIVPAAKLPKKDGKHYEPPDMISEGHLHNQALRKMTKLFLSHLWLVWRSAEGLPIREPYVQEKMGHTTIIDPWEMVDKPEKKSRKAKATAA